MDYYEELYIPPHHYSMGNQELLLVAAGHFQRIKNRNINIINNSFGSPENHFQSLPIPIFGLGKNIPAFGISLLLISTFRF